VIATRQVNEEVLFTTRELTTVTSEDIAWLKAQATLTRRKRIRLCAHPDPAASVHEMLIVHPKDAYVRPHKHLDKDESLHLIEGMVTTVIFEDDGSIGDVIPMGEYGSGRPFYYRLVGSVYHTLLIGSAVVVFHEAIRGPFRKTDMVLAPWAPEEEDVPAVKDFLDRLRETVEGRLASARHGSPALNARTSVR